MKRSAVRGVFGVKGPVAILAPMILAREFPDHAAEWKFIYLYRRDFVRQAVSQTKARLTGAWNSRMAPTQEVGVESYDGGQIRGKIAYVFSQRRKWRAVFSALEVAAHEVAYEDLVADPATIAKTAARYADLDGPPIERESPAYEAQADAVNDQWAERFRRENRAFCERMAASPC